MIAQKFILKFYFIVFILQKEELKASVERMKMLEIPRPSFLPSFFLVLLTLSLHCLSIESLSLSHTLSLSLSLSLFCCWKNYARSEWGRLCMHAWTLSSEWPNRKKDWKRTKCKCNVCGCHEYVCVCVCVWAGDELNKLYLKFSPFSPLHDT